MILEICDGPEKGRRVTLRDGATVSFGRTETAMDRFPEDPAMSSLHFVLSLSAGVLRMHNHSQTNGTMINGTRVESAVVQPGDTIAAGGTVFRVVGPPPNPYPAQLRVGGWGFNIIPDGWKPMEGVGLIHQGTAQFRATAACLEEPLAEVKTLRSYIELQMEVAKSRLKAPAFQNPVDATMTGAEEALLLTVSSDLREGLRIVQRQIYARSGNIVGILTMSGLPAANRDLIEIVHGATFHKPQIPA
ncbi:MAG TPA: FHA domain-containing protein [Bryobacteraceae bacterium]|jgi:hypothetical protein|nr:FHA domain-containing protein [Bryobacteraceae bacterium]